MKGILRITIGFWLLMSCAELEETQELPIMGDLDAGIHQVGYRSLFVYDETKDAVPFSDWEGNIYHNEDKSHGRQFQINIWYPAKKGSGSKFKYEHYVNMMGKQTNFDDLPEQQEFAKELFLNQTNELGGVGEFTRSDMDKLLDLDVLARLNADVLTGSFPVVIYPNGSSPAFQSITSEFLASHGYVVVAFAPKGRFAFGLEVSTIGIETAVGDLEFVLQKTAEFPNANAGNVSLIGNAISSSICAATVARNRKIRSFISLEGGLLSAFEQRLLEGSVFYQPDNIQVPSLMIYAPHPSIDPKHTYGLIHSKKYYAHFPDMSEFVMLNFGMFDSILPDIIGKHKGNPSKGFEAANEMVLKFLNVYAKDGNTNSFSREFLASTSDVVDTTFILEAVPAQPNLAELKDIFLKQGFEPIDAIYLDLKQAGNPTPFSRASFTAFKDWLAWKKDSTYTYRKLLYELAVDSYPESCLINYRLGYYSEKNENQKQAAKFYKRALVLAESDGDVTLSENSRMVIKKNANSFLSDYEEF